MPRLTLPPTLPRRAALGLGAVLLGGLLSVSIGSPRPPAGQTPDAGAGVIAGPVADDREGAYTSPRRVLARIQTNLEHVAAGTPPITLPPPPAVTATPDPLEAVVDAYRAYLAGDLAAAAAALDAVEASGRARLEAHASTRREPSDAERGKDASPAAYGKLIRDVADGADHGPEGTLIRLAAALRLADAVLLLDESSGFNEGYDLFERADAYLMRPRDAVRDKTWLRLPCRTIVGRRAAVEAAATRLGRAAGVLVGCPAPPGRERDLAWMERFAGDPAGASAELPLATGEAPVREEWAQRIPKKPWGRREAVAYMGDDPDAAEPALKAAADLLGKLDYALFLHAFRPPSEGRDAAIRRLMADVDRASRRKDDSRLGDTLIQPRHYDGGDLSLIPSIQLASGTGAVNSSSAFYAIPCAVLLARPGLLEATAPMFGSNRDNFAPRSGCAWGRGEVRGFPDGALDAFTTLAVEADGHFYENHGGSMRFFLAKVIAQERERLAVDPRSLLDERDPPMAEPYEAWSTLSLANRDTFLRLLPRATAARHALVAHYTSRGLSAADAATAAQRGLFHVVWGARCGEAPPPRSLRRLLLERAPAEVIRAFIAAGEHRDRERIWAHRRCAAPADPLMLVAVADAPALPLLWDLARGLPPEEASELDLSLAVDARNAIGKTALMTAAQHDEIASARWLLAHGAHLELDTMAGRDEPLAHDGRTALMYAAARGSLDAIRLLLDAGADAHRADTRGITPLGYLLGQGPVPSNGRLTPAQRSEAARLLW